MLDITRKKYSDDMKFTVTRAYTHMTVAELREELLRVKSIVNYWEEKLFRHLLAKSMLRFKESHNNCRLL